MYLDSWIADNSAWDANVTDW
jgi:hypothetical protein